MKEIKKEIVRHIGVISESTRGWQLELNMVRWDGGEPNPWLIYLPSIS